jgi:hypothetical protein
MKTSKKQVVAITIIIQFQPTIKGTVKVHSSANKKPHQLKLFDEVENEKK